MLPRLLLAALSLPLLAGCPNPGLAPAMPVGARYPSEVKTGSVSQLVAGSVITEAEQELRDIQTRDTEMVFPVKIGVMSVQYRSSLKAEDRQTAFDEARAKLMASGHVREVFEIPENVITGGESLDNLRKMAARFQADVLFMTSGSSTMSTQDAPSAGFWDIFSNRTSYEARTSLSGLGLDVYAGVFMTPVQVATVAGPLVADSSASDFSGSTYKLYREAEMDALNKLHDNLITALAAKRTALENAKLTP